MAGLHTAARALANNYFFLPSFIIRAVAVIGFNSTTATPVVGDDELSDFFCKCSTAQYCGSRNSLFSSIFVLTSLGLIMALVTGGGSGECVMRFLPCEKIVQNFTTF